MAQDNQVGHVRAGIAGLGDMDFVAEPPQVALFAGASLHIIGRTQHALLLLSLRPCPPVGSAFGEIVVLLPGLSQHLHTLHLLESRRRIGSLQGR